MELPDLETVFVFADPAGSEERLLALAKLPEVQNDPPYYCELLTRLARSQGLQRKFEQAHATLDQAEAMSQDSSARRIRVPLERGRIFNSVGDKERAEPPFKEAYAKAIADRNDPLAVDALHMLGIVTNGEESLAWNEKAISLAESSRDPGAKKWFGPLYNNTGWTYHDSGNYERALELFTRALAWRTEKQQDKEILIARWCVARCLRSMGRVKEALEIQRSLLQEHEKAGGEDGYVSEELGELLLAKGDPREAAKHFAVAYERLSKDPWLQANERARLERILELSRA